MNRILEVKEVELLIMESHPPQLMINALGNASTPGWSNAQLKLLDSDPKDGIYEYEFLADPPDGIIPQVIMPIKASLHLTSIPEDFKGARVFAAKNEMEQTLGTNQSRIRPEINQPELLDSIERLLGLTVTDNSLSITVATGGCTDKKSFRVDVRTGFTGLQPYLITVYRIIPDHCRGFFPEGIKIDYSFKELGIPEDSDIIVLNPIAKRQNKPPFTFPDRFPIPSNPFPLPQPLPWPFPTNPAPPFPWPFPSDPIPSQPYPWRMVSPNMDTDRD